MPRVLKSSVVTIDNEKRVTIENELVNIKKHEETSNSEIYFEQDEKIDEEEESSISLVEKAQKGADLIIQKAKERADMILQEAHKEAEEIKDCAFEEGKEEGYNLGYNEGANEAESLKDSARNMVDEAISFRNETYKNLEPEILNLIVGIIDKLLANTIEIDKDLILVLIRKGIEAAHMTSEITIRVSASDYENVLANREDIFTLIENQDELKIVKDLSLSSLDCIIETPYGNIDSSLDRQKKYLIDNLYTLLNDANEGM